MQNSNFSPCKIQINQLLFYGKMRFATALVASFIGYADAVELETLADAK